MTSDNCNSAIENHNYVKYGCTNSSEKNRQIYNKLL